MPFGTPPATSRGAAPTWFSDDFGSLDSNNWHFLDRQSDQVNGEVNACVPVNVTAAGSRISITAKNENYDSNDRDVNPPHDFVTPLTTFNYTSGHIMQRTAPFLYGTVSARLKLPSGNGVWPCFWLLGELWQPSQPYTANVAGHDWPNGGWWEADIAEFMGGVRTSANMQLHYNSSHPGGQQTLGFDASTRFAIYRLQWSLNSMIWSVDAEDGNGFVQKHSVTGAGNVPDTAAFVILNMAVGGIGGGGDLSGPWPMTMQVDWVRVTRP